MVRPGPYSAEEEVAPIDRISGNAGKRHLAAALPTDDGSGGAVLDRQALERHAAVVLVVPQQDLVDAILEVRDRVAERTVACHTIGEDVGIGAASEGHAAVPGGLE